MLSPREEGLDSSGSSHPDFLNLIVEKLWWRRISNVGCTVDAAGVRTSHFDGHAEARGLCAVVVLEPPGDGGVVEDTIDLATDVTEHTYLHLNQIPRSSMAQHIFRRDEVLWEERQPLCKLA